jgi:hypothetical protein
MAKKIAKIKIEVDNDSKIKIHAEKDSDADNEEDSATGPFPTTVKDLETIEIVLTNPCTWIKIGGQWKKICW